MPTEISIQEFLEGLPLLPVPFSVYQLKLISSICEDAILRMPKEYKASMQEHGDISRMCDAAIETFAKLQNAIVDEMQSRQITTIDITRA